MKFEKAIFFAAAALILFGCSKRDPDAAFDVYAADPREVMAEVNGQAVRIEDFLGRQQTELAFYLYANGKKSLKDAELPSSLGARLDKMRKQREGYIFAELVNQALIGQYLTENKIVISAEDEEQDILKTLQKVNFKGNIQDFAAFSGVDCDVLRRHVVWPLQVRRAIEHFDSSITKVSDEEIDAGLKRQDDYKALAIASNAVTFATCSNILARVAAGEDFAKLGETNGFSPEEADEWDDLVHDEFTNPEFEKWAFSAPVGSVGGPYELDDCIAIFKILDRVEGAEKVSMAAKEVASVRLARMGFPVIDPEPEPHTREFVRESYLKWKAKKAQKAIFGKLHGEMKLEYPNGTNFVYGAGL